MCIAQTTIPPCTILALRLSWVSTMIYINGSKATNGVPSWAEETRYYPPASPRPLTHPLATPPTPPQHLPSPSHPTVLLVQLRGILHSKKVQTSLARISHFMDIFVVFLRWGKWMAQDVGLRIGISEESRIHLGKGYRVGMVGICVSMVLAVCNKFS